MPVDTVEEDNGKEEEGNTEGFLIILCGFPASGKSIFAKSLKSFMESKPPLLNSSISQNDKINPDLLKEETIKIFEAKVGILDTDIIRNTLFGDKFEPHKENTVRKTALDQTRKMLEQNMIVISDDINYFESMRHEYVELCESLNKFYFIVYISTPLEVCLKWNNLRKDPLKEEIITKISDRFDKPGLKYYWDSPLIELDLSKIEVNKAVKMVYERILEDFIWEKENKKNKGKKQKEENKIERKMGNSNLISKNLNKEQYSIKMSVDSITRKFMSIYTIIAKEFEETYRNLSAEGKPSIVSNVKKENILIKMNLILDKIGNSIRNNSREFSNDIKNFNANDPVIKEIYQLLTKKIELHDCLFKIVLQYGTSIHTLNNKRREFVQEYNINYKNNFINVTTIFSIIKDLLEKLSDF